MSDDLNTSQLEYLQRISHDVRSIKRFHYWQFWGKIAIWVATVGVIIWGLSKVYSVVSPIFESNIISKLTGQAEKIDALEEKANSFQKLFQK